MIELIYSFLLQSDFPRASIVYDVDLLKIGASDQRLTVPALIIVDPFTADPLAVIDVLPAVDAEDLKAAAIETGAYASELAGKHIQGFVVRVDVHGQTDAEQVQFYKIWPNSTLRQLSSKTFPDLDALRVARMLMLDVSVKPVPEAMNISAPVVDIEDGFGLNEHEEKSKESTSPGMYIPALLLLLLFFLDAVFHQITGASILTVAQSILALGAAALFTLPSFAKYFRS